MTHRPEMPSTWAYVGPRVLGPHGRAPIAEGASGRRWQQLFERLRRLLKARAAARNRAALEVANAACGQVLCELQALTPHGHWAAVLAAVALQSSTACRLMRLARRMATGLETARTHLTIQGTNEDQR